MRADSEGWAPPEPRRGRRRGRGGVEAPLALERKSRKRLRLPPPPVLPRPPWWDPSDERLLSRRGDAATSTPRGRCDGLAQSEAPPFPFLRHNLPRAGERGGWVAGKRQMALVSAQPARAAALLWRRLLAGLAIPPHPSPPRCRRFRSGPRHQAVPFPSPSLFLSLAVRLRQSRLGAAGDSELRAGGLGGHQVSGPPPPTPSQASPGGRGRATTTTRRRPMRGSPFPASIPGEAPARSRLPLLLPSFPLSSWGRGEGRLFFRPRELVPSPAQLRPLLAWPGSHALPGAAQEAERSAGPRPRETSRGQRDPDSSGLPGASILLGRRRGAAPSLTSIPQAWLRSWWESNWGLGSGA